MAKFRFNLQAVLVQREMVEQRRQKAVALLETERLRIEGVISGLQSRLEDEQRATRDLSMAGDIAGVRQQALAKSRIRAEAQRAAIELAGVLKRLDDARAQLLEAAKARKAVELLKERRFEAWKTEIERAEQSVLDELAVMRAARAGDEEVVA